MVAKSVIIWFDNFYLVVYRKSRMHPAEHEIRSRPQIVAPIIIDGETVMLFWEM